MTGHEFLSGDPPAHGGLALTHTVHGTTQAGNAAFPSWPSGLHPVPLGLSDVPHPISDDLALGLVRPSVSACMLKRATQGN